MSEALWCVRAGLVPYEDARRVRDAVAMARRAGELGDVVLLLEHPPVYTRGRRTEPGELPMGEDWYRMQGIEVRDTDRGGRVTYHGPGQLVAYPIVDLRPSGGDVRAYVRHLEAAMIAALGAFGVEAVLFDGLTGVWTAGTPPLPAGSIGPQGTRVGAARGAAAGLREARKIGSIGVHVRAGVTTHGLAVNVDNDLQPFEWIVPCGIEAARMTSLAREIGAEQDLGAFAGSLAVALAERLGREPVEVPVAELAELVRGAGVLTAPRTEPGRGGVADVARLVS